MLHVCLQRVSQLELWLQEAQRILRSTGVAAGSHSMQRDSVEQRLLTCQVSPAHQDINRDSQVVRGDDVASEVKLGE